MEKLAKTINLGVMGLGALTLSACVAPVQKSNLNQRTVWRIEQNPVGKFTYCQTGLDCPERTEKTIRQRRVEPQPTVLPEFDQKKVVAQVYFAFGKGTVTGRSKTILAQALPKMKSAKKLILRGWTDPVGGVNSPVNRKLALLRAEGVKRWLVANGVDASIIAIEAYPPCCNNPLATAKSPDTVRSKMRTVTIERLD